MLPIQRYARGLLEFLQLKGVAVPNGLIEGVQPTIDFTPHYTSPLVSDSAPTVGALAPTLADTLAFTRPVKLLAVGGQLIIGAAAATNVTAYVRLTQTGLVGVALFSQFYGAIGAGATINFGVYLPQPLIVDPSFLMQVFVTGTAAGVDHSLAAVSLLDPLTP